MFVPLRDSSDAPLEKILGGVSLGTMLATIPQVIEVWSAPTVSGVSLVSWIAYLAGACLWLIHGLRKHDRSMYLACIGWIALDGAVVLGIIARRA